MPHVYLKQQVKRCKNTSPYNRDITKEGIQCWSLNALELIAIEIGASLETLFVSLSVASDSHEVCIHTQAQRLFGKRRATMYSSYLSLISLPYLQCYLHHTNFLKVRGLKTGEGLE